MPIPLFFIPFWKVYLIKLAFQLCTVPSVGAAPFHGRQSDNPTRHNIFHSKFQNEARRTVESTHLLEDHTLRDFLMST